MWSWLNYLLLGHLVLFYTLSFANLWFIFIIYIVWEFHLDISIWEMIILMFLKVLLIWVHSLFKQLEVSMFLVIFSSQFFQTALVLNLSWILQPINLIQLSGQICYLLFIFLEIRLSNNLRIWINRTRLLVISLHCLFVI